MILAMAAVLSFAAISCTPEEEYTPGKPDSEECFGIYFPSQEATSKTFTLEPGDSHRIKVKVSRAISDGDIIVPAEITADDIFEVQEIKFEDGQTTTDVWVEFDGAELGKKYTCTIEVNDPLYVSNYRVNANFITFSVLIASWDALGEATYIDYSFTNTSTGEPLTTTTKVYRNSNDENVYRIDDPYTKMMEAAGVPIGTRPPEYFLITVLQRGETFKAYEGAEEITIPISDLVHYEPINIAYKDSQYGDAYYYHPSLLTGFEDPLTWYDNRVMNWLDDAKTEPGVIQLAPSMYFPSAGGFPPAVCARIVFPGAKLTDYTLTVTPGLTKDGKVPVKMSFTEDLAEVRYAVFEGELLESKIKGRVKDIEDGKVDYETVSKAGDYNIEGLKKTGRYTLVAVGFNSEGESVSSTSAVFGYLKDGDSRKVDINCGLIVSDKYAKEGYTGENSAEFYIYGTDITQAYYGLYRKKDFEEKYDRVMEDLLSYKATAAELEAINGNGLTDLFIRLNSGMEYVLVVCATNGYEEVVLSASALLDGEINPLQMTYELNMLSPAETRDDYCGEWVFWTGTPQSNGRTEVGPLTISDGGVEVRTIENEDGTETEIEVEYLNVKGFWKPAVDEGYLKNDTMKWEYYGGAIVPLHGEVGTWRDTGGNLYRFSMISFFTSGQGGFADGAVCGAFTDEGNIAFVDMETGNYDDQGDYWFTSLGIFDEDGNYMQQDLLAYDDMMFVDPENSPASPAETSSSLSMLMDVKANYQKNFNYVEYKRHQLYKAIDMTLGQVRSFKDRAGLDIDMENSEVDCTLTPAPGSNSFITIGEPADLISRK